MHEELSLLTTLNEFKTTSPTLIQRQNFIGPQLYTGLEAVAEIKKLFPDQENLAPVALRWILMF